MENWDPISLIKKVGKGKTLSKHLTQSEAKHAFDLIISGKFTDAQLGAFLQAQRIKELSLEELQGFSEAMSGYFTLGHQVEFNLDESSKTLVLNLCLDSPRKVGLISGLAAHLLPYLGIHVALVTNTPLLASHSPRPSNAKGLFAWSHLVESLHKKGEPKLGRFPKDKYREFTANQLVPSWANLETVRTELGFRSFLHTLEKVMNPFPLTPLLLGIAHQQYAPRLTATLQYLEHKKSKVILGNHGSLDLNLHKPTTYFYWQEGVQSGEIPSPQSLGLEISSSLYLLSNFDKWKTYIEQEQADMWNALFYHLSFFLWCAGEVDSMEMGLHQVKQTFVF